jgi:hypothetical protein
MRIKRVREITTIEPTRDDKGLKLVTTVIGYDNGQVYLDGVPMNGTEIDDAWISSVSVFCQQVLELKRRCAERQRKAPSKRQRKAPSLEIQEPFAEDWSCRKSA